MYIHLVFEWALGFLFCSKRNVNVLYCTMCGEGLTKLLKSTCVCLDSICDSFHISKYLSSLFFCKRILTSQLIILQNLKQFKLVNLYLQGLEDWSCGHWRTYLIGSSTQNAKSAPSSLGANSGCDRIIALELVAKEQRGEQCSRWKGILTKTWKQGKWLLGWRLVMLRLCELPGGSSFNQCGWELVNGREETTIVELNKGLCPAGGEFDYFWESEGLCSGWRWDQKVGSMNELPIPGGPIEDVLEVEACIFSAELVWVWMTL